MQHSNKQTIQCFIIHFIPDNIKDYKKGNSSKKQFEREDEAENKQPKTQT